MTPFDHPRHLKSRVPPPWGGVRVYLYLIRAFSNRTNIVASLSICIHVISVTSAFATTYRAYQYAEHTHPKNVDKSIQFIERRSPRIVCGLLFSPANTKIVYHSPSSEAQGSQWGRREARQTLLSTGERAPSGTDSHRTISKRSIKCWLLILHKKFFVLLYPIGKQHRSGSVYMEVRDPRKVK